jgi:16S rRNA (guanine1207-N2)-methyltransferase
MASYIETPAAGAHYHQLDVRIGNEMLTLWSAAGLFSKNRIDPGSRLLISTVPVRSGERVLDLGCGIGVVGIALLRRAAVQMTFADVNTLALRVTRRNLAALGLAGDVVHSHLFEKIPGAFEWIVTNPPIVAGRAVLYQLIDEAPSHLVAGGRLALVARHNKGGAMLAKRMAAAFGGVEVLDKKAGYRVYCAQKAD